MIDEKRLIEDSGKLKVRYFDNDKRPYVTLYDFCNLIVEQPKIGKWIPCDPDTMPKDREDVLILWGGGNRSTAYYVSGGAGGWFFNYGFDYIGNRKVPYEPYV